MPTRQFQGGNLEVSEKAGGATMVCPAASGAPSPQFSISICATAVYLKSGVKSRLTTVCVLAANQGMKSSCEL